MPGSSLFVLDTGNALIEEFKYLGPSYDEWSGPFATGLAGEAPGAPAEIAGGLQMLVVTATGFTEMQRAAAQPWTHIHDYVPSDLGHPASGGKLLSPSLTPDGRVLVYVYTGGTGAAIYYVRRAKPTDPFGQGTRLVTVSGTTFTSPVLAADCLKLFAVDAASGNLIEFDH
jgi:hypothetical protein